MSEMSKLKAIEDLATIRDTIDRGSNSTIFKEYVQKSSVMLMLFGVIISLSIVLTWFIGLNEVVNSGGYITLVWLVAIFLITFANIALFKKLSSNRDLDMNTYIKKILSKSFFEIDLPIEIGGTILMAYFIISDQTVMILPLMALMFGILISNLGSVFKANGMKIVGYLSILVGAVGFFTPGINFYIYSLSAFGIFWIFWGIMLFVVTKKEKSHGTQR